MVQIIKHKSNSLRKAKKEHGVPSAVVTNHTSYDLKVSLQFKDQSSKEQETIEKTIPREVNGNDIINFTKTGSLTGYNGAKFSVKNVIGRIGINAENWTGEFTGKNMELTHIFEYKAVVQHPTKNMSTVGIKMIVSYEGNIMNIIFLAPDGDFND